MLSDNKKKIIIFQKKINQKKSNKQNKSVPPQLVKSSIQSTHPLTLPGISPVPLLLYQTAHLDLLDHALPRLLFLLRFFPGIAHRLSRRHRYDSRSPSD